MMGSLPGATGYQNSLTAWPEQRVKVQTADFIQSTVRSEDLLDDGLPQVAFAGRSNVGKSSLLNRLVGRKRLARISSTPGRTRAINYFLINSRFYFVDLPGYGYAKVSKTERRAWGRLLEAYLRTAAGRAEVVQLVDAKVGATALDHQSVDYLESLGISPIVVATKIDRVPSSRRHAVLRELARDLALEEEARLVAFSARTGEGTKELWKEIHRYLERKRTRDEVSL